MLYDDRLGTVLRLRANGPAVLRIQFRQLLDLLGTYPADAQGSQLEEAYHRLGELSRDLPAEDRAQAIGEAGLRLRSPRLVKALAECEPAVAANTLCKAQLSVAQWLDLIPAISPSARNHLKLRNDLPTDAQNLLSRLGVERPALPPANATDKDPAPAAAEGQMASEPIPPQAQSGIGEIVRRIEAYRRAREDYAPAEDTPHTPPSEPQAAPMAEQLRVFDFTTDAECRITWSEAAVAPMVNGVRLADVAQNADCAVLMRRQQPLRSQAVELEGAPAVAGSWLLDAAPWFDQMTGRFIGYRGRMRRTLAAPSPSELSRTEPQSNQGDRIRQVLHELRTPVNAIQGFAEVIQQQLFGPTPHEYRAIAAEIAADAARVLAAFDELDRLAKLSSGAMQLEAGETDLAGLAEAAVAQLSGHTAPQGSGFSLHVRGETPLVGLAQIEVERILWRLFAVMASVSTAGEIIKLNLEPDGAGLRLNLALPARLAAIEGDSIFGAAADAVPQSLAVGLFGIGFTLRLARAEARAAGGNLSRNDNFLSLTLPGLSAQNIQPTAPANNQTH